MTNRFILFLHSNIYTCVTTKYQEWPHIFRKKGIFGPKGQTKGLVKCQSLPQELKEGLRSKAGLCLLRLYEIMSF